ncbi:hypothetical protein PWY87_22215 [Kribbella solani]|uniref:DUF7660 family protein n=1 Tax=Kribbella solani TaxID=236067 RepID=UPI0029A4C606|nr:hypothetical protein [Kribbella solani]MDX3004420.1 hypothetical protein [Kribbella solani]
MLEDNISPQLDRAGFQAFLVELADSFEENPDAWENGTLESYLRAWSAWLGDADGYFERKCEAFPQNPSWRMLAQMLLAARVYE